MTRAPLFLSLDETIARDTPIDPSKIIRGTPKTGVAPASENSDKKFYTGQWSSDAGAWRVNYTEEELCVILSGSGALIAEDGTRYPFKAGDAFVIPEGFSGIWENETEIRKIYAIVE